MQFVKDDFMGAFGDFNATELYNTDLEWAFFFIYTAIVTLIMMNLLIGIVGES